MQKFFCNKFVTFLQNAFFNFLSIDQNGFSSRLKKRAVNEEIGCSLYFQTTVTYWVNTALQIVSKFMIMEITQTKRISNAFTTGLTNFKSGNINILRPKRKTLLFPHMWVTRKIFTLAAANLFFLSI